MGRDPHASNDTARIIDHDQHHRHLPADTALRCRPRVHPLLPGQLPHQARPHRHRVGAQVDEPARNVEGVRDALHTPPERRYPVGAHTLRHTYSVGRSMTAVVAWQSQWLSGNPTTTPTRSSGRRSTTPISEQSLRCRRCRGLQTPERKLVGGSVTRSGTSWGHGGKREAAACELTTHSDSAARAALGDLVLVPGVEPVILLGSHAGTSVGDALEARRDGLAEPPTCLDGDLDPYPLQSFRRSRRR